MKKIRFISGFFDKVNLILFFTSIYLGIYSIIHNKNPINNTQIVNFKVPREIKQLKDSSTFQTNLSLLNLTEIEEAVQYLQLPTHSLSFKNCFEKESEYSCNDLLNAFHLIKAYEYNITNTKEKDRKYFILRHPIKGLGNKMETDVVGFLLALMSNRTILVESNYPKDNSVVYDHIYQFPSYVLTNRQYNLSNDDLQLLNEAEESSILATFVPTGIDWCCFNIEKNIIKSRSKFIFLNDLLYASMIYANKETNDFARKHFGKHCVFFISNYFSRFPLSVIDKVDKLVQSKTTKNSNISLLGLHMRYHRAGQYYSHGLNFTLPVFFEEIDRRIEENPKTILVLATDSEDIKKSVVSKYGEKRVIFSPDITRKADKDHIGAMCDMYLLSYCNSLIATYRSTFSFMAVSRTGKNAFWVEKEAKHSFPGSFSQCCGISMIYHHRDNCDWRTNDRIKICSKEHKETIQSFFDDFVL